MKVKLEKLNKKLPALKVTDTSETAIKEEV